MREPRAAAPDNRIALLPPYRGPFGPVTKARLARLGAIYLALLALGSALVFLFQADALRILGLGLVLPGGGFLAHGDLCTSSGIGHVAAALCAMGLFGFSLLLWFGTGNILAPPLLWLGTAIVAAGMRHGVVQSSAIVAVYAVLAVSIVGIGAVVWIRDAMARRRRQLDNAYLVGEMIKPEGIFAARSSEASPEMSLQELQRLRFALDRALQPPERFDGFEKIDQFQTAALRYQLNFLGYGISLAQARYMPAFGGYMHQAQLALLDKQRQHRVWSYWKWENLWGNLGADPDPVARDNIMYTGFIALQMGLFHAASGRRDFDRTGRFTLFHPAGMRYTHHAKSLVDRLEHDYRRSDFYLIACEPNWVYPLCNTIGACAIVAHDRQHKQNRWARHAHVFRWHLEEEFLDGFGRYLPCRSAHTGLAFPAVGGVMPQAMPCFFLNAFAPDLARRQWLLLRRSIFDEQGRLRRRAFWPVDTGNYGFSRAAAYAATALAAAELGDEEVRSACLQALEEECPSVLAEGVMHRRNASVWAHGVEIMARACARNHFRNTILEPHVPDGLRLEGLQYPGVLVASAHAREGNLHAVLYAGIRDGAHEIGLCGLRPYMRYRVVSETVSSVLADAQGNARAGVVLAGRTCLKVELEGYS